MTNLCCNVLNILHGKTLATAESCTGGWIGKALTCIPGSSAIYKGGIISYTNFVKQHVLNVDSVVLDKFGAVSKETATDMAKGVRNLLQTDVAVSVTGLAGPGGDEFNHKVGTVYIACATEQDLTVREYHFCGDREEVRSQAVKAALELILICMQKEPAD